MGDGLDLLAGRDRDAGGSNVTFQPLGAVADRAAAAMSAVPLFARTTVMSLVPARRRAHVDPLVHGRRG